MPYFDPNSDIASVITGSETDKSEYNESPKYFSDKTPIHRLYRQPPPIPQRSNIFNNSEKVALPKMVDFSPNFSPIETHRPNQNIVREADSLIPQIYSAIFCKLIYN